MFCRRCGTELPDLAVQCPTCGERVAHAGGQYDQATQSGSPGSQPRQPAPQTASPPPPNYLVWAILATLFCCLPFGVVAIVFAAQVESKWFRGDCEGSLQASKNARVWCWVSFAMGLGLTLIWVLFLLLGVFAQVAAQGG